MQFQRAKQTKKYKLLTFVAFLLMLGACNSDLEKFPFQPNTKEYFNYGDNEVWIFKNRNSGALDTIASSDATTGFTGRDLQGEVEISTATLTSPKVNKLIVRAEAIASEELDRIAVLQLTGGTFVQGPVLINLSNNFVPEDSSTVAEMLNINLEGLSYPEVLDITLIGHPNFSNLWFARNTGIIRMVYLNGDTMDLIKHQP